MDTYERSVWVDAPLDAVWEFHSTEDGLVALTPDWMNLQVESVRGPDGEADPQVLDAGSEIQASVQPFGLGPRQTWTSEITEREHEEGTAHFTDVMHDGPFAFWEHTHQFYADSDGTLIRDSIQYELPLGAVGRALGPVAVVGFEPMFRFRHKTTKKLLE
jgi:ligand-binding SRPBCC domain-containing protein